MRAVAERDQAEQADAEAQQGEVPTASAAPHGDRPPDDGVLAWIRTELDEAVMVMLRARGRSPRASSLGRQGAAVVD